MANLKQQIYETIVAPAISNITTSTTGSIFSIDSKNMTADVVIQNPKGKGVLGLKNVPIQISGGISASGPFPGDKVIVNFNNNNYFNPTITSVVDNNYDNNTSNVKQKHTRKGVFVPDLMSERSDWGMKSDIWG